LQFAIYLTVTSTLQAFVFLSAEYETPKNSLNQVCSLHYDAFRAGATYIWVAAIGPTEILKKHRVDFVLISNFYPISVENINNSQSHGRAVGYHRR
jgi:hypothetical protein